MARARNIKPSFFENDTLADLPPLYRLFFIGLWTVADFKGCLEYRPKRLKAQILPYDDADIGEIVLSLEKSRFVATYNLQGTPYLKVLNFTKHQNPHPAERKKKEVIPDLPEDDTQPVDSIEDTTSNLQEMFNNLEQPSNNADSLLLIPSNPITDSLECGAVPAIEQGGQFTSFDDPIEKPHTQTAGKFAMRQDWKPEPITWEANRMRAGIINNDYDDATLVDFILYWSGEMAVLAESQWQGKLIQSIQNRLARTLPKAELDKLIEATSGATRSNWAVLK